MSDLYHQTYQDEIFVKSQCIWHENTLVDFIRHNLIALGWQQDPEQIRRWTRGSRQVIVCLVDDIFSCNHDGSNTAYQFSPDTLVITDNWISTPTVYQVARVPNSFFGIYHHDPSDQLWKPDRRFCFSQRRIDSKRLELFLEIMYRAHDVPTRDRLDYVNMNCWSWDSPNQTDQDLRENFLRAFDNLNDAARSTYSHLRDRFAQDMPLRNHTLTHEQMHVSAWINTVVETYSSDNTIAFSEKIFRVLCLPVPWMIYAGRNAVAYLRCLGFDVMHDVVQHRYDTLCEQQTLAYGDKPVDWIYEATETVDRLKSLPFADLSQRCAKAAAHNRSQLLAMRQRWPGDFAQWWAQLMPQLQ